MALFSVATILVVSTFGASQAPAKTLTPKNDSRDKRNLLLGEIHGNNPSDDCWSHHKGEGMTDAVVVFPVAPKQLKLGEPYDIPVQIINPWKQDLREMSLDVSLLGEQVLTVEGTAAGAAAQSDVYYEWRDELVGPAQPTPGAMNEPPRRVFINFSVPRGAVAIVSHVELFPRAAAPDPGGGVATKDGYIVKFRTESESLGGGTEYNPPVSDNEANQYVLKRSLAKELRASGNVSITIYHQTGFARETRVYANATIVMGGGGAAGAKTYSIKIPSSATVLKNAPPYTAIVRVTPFAKGVQAMEFHVRTQNYYGHLDGVTPDEDYYNRYANLSQDSDLISGRSITPQRAIAVGDTFIPSEFSPVGATVAQDQWQFVLAEITGFSSAILLLPSLLLGGTYGKQSRRFFNWLLGGAKRRVMFHNLMSLGLSIVALVHIVLFLYEIRYTVLMGVLWGGLASLCLLVLGLTGYYQVPLIQRHGYQWWRVTHLAFGLLVVFFVAYHMIADGPDFQFVRDVMPQWLRDFNLAYK